ncbi:hypothetical protein RhiirA5_363206 [Rhizophagus irregularis]|uniref:Uncharacterized protein n=1 Tax=Rhizophagus irregularis TaxID=588596 RepID=A0A2N0P9H8_9GLOM|nr:hypothetical protein RhiirA5_363206 [Rhizophagus irregularis]
MNIHKSEEGLLSYVHCIKSAVAYWVKKYRQDKNLADEQKSSRLHNTPKHKTN